MQPFTELIMIITSQLQCKIVHMPKYKMILMTTIMIMGDSHNDYSLR